MTSVLLHNKMLGPIGFFFKPCLVKMEGQNPKLFVFLGKKTNEIFVSFFLEDKMYFFNIYNWAFPSTLGFDSK